MNNKKQSPNQYSLPKSIEKYLKTMLNMTNKKKLKTALKKVVNNNFVNVVL